MGSGKSHIHQHSCHLSLFAFKVTDTPIQVSDILVLPVCFKFINFSFQIFLLFVPEMSSFMSYVVQITSIILVWIL
jgi:hypothetical protein